MGAAVAPGTAQKGVGAKVPVLAEISHGFDRLLFADALGALTQITDAAFAEYGTDPGMIADMRNRFAQWRRGLLAAGTS